MLQQTSLLAYRDIQPDLGFRQAAVYGALQGKLWMCNQEIADDLHWPINTVTPRIMELRAKGLVAEHHKDIYLPTGRKVIFWSLT